MRAGLLALILATTPATADISRWTLACDAVTAAPGCQAAATLWDFEPTGGIVALPDRLRLAGIERFNGADRPVILDLSLPGGDVLALVPLIGEVPIASVTTFSPDGSILLVVPIPDWSKITEDALLPQTVLAFDAWGKPIGRAEGLAVTAMTDAMGENRLRFDGRTVTLDLSATAEPALVSIDLATGAATDGPITDGAWLYDYVFDRDRGWHQGGTVVETRFSRDGAPSSVVLRGRDKPLAGGVPGVYDREFLQPVLSPDATRLAVLQLADGAPGPILLALSLPEGREFWRAIIAEEKDRPALYRWTAGGALVTLQPQAGLRGVNTLVVYQPQE